MNIDLYYNNLAIRLISLIVLSIVLSGVYLIYIKQTGNQSYLKHSKSIYFIQIVFWALFLSNLLGSILPNNVIGSYLFELILLSLIFISFTFVLWKAFKKNQLDYGIIFSTLPLIILFIVALGMV